MAMRVELAAAAFLYLLPALLSAKVETQPTTETINMTKAPIPRDDDMDMTFDEQTAMSECNETFRTEMEYIASLKDSGSFPDETDKTPKCYVRCMLEKTGVVSADGVFDAARAAEVFGGTRGGHEMTDVAEMAAACSLRGESCKCERSYNFMKCLMESQIMKYGN